MFFTQYSMYAKLLIPHNTCVKHFGITYELKPIVINAFNILNTWQSSISTQAVESCTTYRPLGSHTQHTTSVCLFVNLFSFVILN